MPADETQHQLFVRLSPSVLADRTQVNRRRYFVLWFFNRLQFKAEEHKIPAQQQAVNVISYFGTTFHVITITTMDIVIVHIFLGILLFFLINWIGKHSFSIGYTEISIFLQNEEAPAFNFLIRVLSPVVYMIITAGILYHFKLDRYVSNVYLINIYYIIFRLAFNIFTNRTLLLNWYRQTLYWSAIVLISLASYEKIVKEKKNLLPDFSTMANELWIIIFIFIFQIVNKIRLSQSETEKRKLSYLQSRYNHFREKFGKQITEMAKSEFIEVVAYAILIYEDFNRPKVVRIVENLRFKLTKKPHTLGVMQVLSSRLLSDRESITMGIEKINNVYANYTKGISDNLVAFQHSEWAAMYSIIQDYNGGSSYNSEVTNLAQTIKERFYNSAALTNP